MLETTTRHRFEAPLVKCRGCGRQYSHKDWVTVLIERIGAHLVACTNCRKPKPKPFIFPIPNKTVGRDVAIRYIIRYDGRTFWHQTDVDEAEVYLQNKHGTVIAKVSQFDTFPKPVEKSVFDDMPF